MERILAIDYGDSRIGIAVSDPLGLTAQGVETVPNFNHEKALLRIGELLAAYQTKRVVLGLPKNMDGSLGERAQITVAFKEELESRFGAVVELVDERLTTVSAIQTLNTLDVRGKKRKEVVDTVAAQLILQQYLESHKIV